MASTAVHSASSAVSFRKENGLTDSLVTKRKMMPKICSIMAPRRTERSPSTTGKMKAGMTMTEKILARASERSQLSPGENVWVNVDLTSII